METPPKSLARIVKDGVGDADRTIDTESVRESYDLDDPDDAQGSPTFADEQLPQRAPPSGEIRRGEEALPVLEAFQAFLDVERQRTRRRMVVMTLFFVAVLIGVAVISLVIGMTLLGDVQDDFRKVKDEIAANRREALLARENAFSAISAFRDQSTQLHADLERDRQALTAVQESVTDRSAQYAGKIDELAEIVGTLVLENSDLRDDVGQLKAGFPGRPDDLSGAIREIAGLHSRIYDPDAIGPLKARPTSLVLSIQPPSAPEAVAWRLPIPE